MTTLKVFTLNCWGLPFPVICKNRQERINALGEYLQQSDIDVAVLEEIWVKSDYQKLQEMVKEKLCHSHYFYSGTIGSGVCVFSKYPILETSFHRFHLNGHAHKFYHGDWFGGKGVGLCKINVGDLYINLYCSHFHAEYNPGNDEYHAHRVCQAFELSQFVRATMAGCDLVVVAGDLNVKPTSVEYRVITLNGELKDSWLDKTNAVSNEFGGTCEVPGNCYTSKELVKVMPNGERIDYIMYRTREGCDAKVECTAGLGKIPEMDINYSDHEVVISTITINKIHDGLHEQVKTGLSKELRESLHDSLLVLDKGISQCFSEGRFFQVALFVLACILYMASAYLDNTVLYGGILFSTSLALVKITLAIGIGFCIWTALIVKRAEFYGLVGTKEDISRLLQYGGVRGHGL